MKIAIGSDHAGFEYKQKIKDFLGRLGHTVIDLGTDSEAPVDYARFVRPVVLMVVKGEAERGIVLGGSGNGEAIVANRIRGIRCALCWNVESARLARQHNDANMLSLGQRMITEQLALEIVRTWLETPFEGGRHARRIELIRRFVSYFRSRVGTERRALFYCDGILYKTRTPADLPAGKTWVFNKPFFILLNLAVGGNWPGNPDETTVFPQTMLVDYVRVYERDTGTVP